MPMHVLGNTIHPAHSSHSISVSSHAMSSNKATVGQLKRLALLHVAVFVRISHPPTRSSENMMDFGDEQDTLVPEL